MAIIRSPENLDNTVNYLATVAFFCGISCVTLMLKFKGFKASLNIFNGKRHSHDYDVLEPGLCLNGAYRTNRDEYFGNDRLPEPPKKLTPSMVKLPESQGTNTSAIRPTKSSNDLTKQTNLPAHLRYSTPSVSLDPRGEEDRGLRSSQNGKQSSVPANQEKEQAKVKKKQLAEQKARDKLAAQEQAKQEKLIKAREKKEAKEKADKTKKNKRDKKVKAPPPPPLPPTISVTQASTRPTQPSTNPLVQTSNYSTNTLDSSISRSSGPPPYSELPNSAPKPELVQNQGDPSGNVSFSKPIETSSWDMVLQHRQQVSSRTTKSTETQNKQRVIDLNYNFNNNNKDNSDA